MERCPHGFRAAGAPDSRQRCQESRDRWRIAGRPFRAAFAGKPMHRAHFGAMVRPGIQGALAVGTMMNRVAVLASLLVLPAVARADDEISAPGAQPAVAAPGVAPAPLPP